MLCPKAVTLQIRPNRRLEVIDVTERLVEQYGPILAEYPKALYYSYHTTAGYLEGNLCAQLNHRPDTIQDFVQSFQELFPPDAGYHHDQLHLRKELSEMQRREESRNADSHLTFIGCGLTNCVTYFNKPQTRAYFVDLDGVYGNRTRRRQTTVIGFTEEEVVARTELSIPVSNHPVDSVNLRDPHLGLFDRLQELLHRYAISKGRIDLSLAPQERNAGLTVNEYETLLMKYDLAQVLRNPLRFAAQKGKHMLVAPGAIPSKAKNYAKYDLVLLTNKLLDVMGLSESLFERIVNKVLAVPAQRFLQMKRSVSLLVSDQEEDQRGSIVQGCYQSPILVQWEEAQIQTRQLRVKLVRFR